MLQQQVQVQRGAKNRLALCFAESESDVMEAQRLRYKVFAEELGARLQTRRPGLDQDLFDPYCEHLLVRDTDSGEVVGTYRILNPEQARAIGGCYADGEFDLTRLGHLRGRMVEVGRSCVHPEYRSGAVITMLWSGLANYMQTRGYEYLIGCASISMADGGHAAASIYETLKRDHMSPVEWRVFPRCPLPLEALSSDLHAAVPALIRGYMRLGAYVGGDPAWDPDFNTADLLMLLPMANMSAHYARHFFR